MRIINLSKVFLSSIIYLVLYSITVSVFIFLAINGFEDFAVFSYIALFILASIICFYISKKYVHIVINKCLTIIIYTLLIAGLFAILSICIPNFLTFFLFSYYIFCEMFHNEFVEDLMFIQFILPIIASIFGVIRKPK